MNQASQRKNDTRHQTSKPPTRLTDPKNKNVQVDANIANRAKELLSEEHTGDEHYPGQENVKRINLHKDLPRRT
jgi:hypothetical protein